MESMRGHGNAWGWRHSALAVVLLGPLALVLGLPPIRQDLGYHAFADTRAFVGIPNFFDVVSNLPFLLVALAGMRSCAGLRPGGVRDAWTTAFIGVGLISAGSMYYHLAPSNGTLVWDRAPMTLAFMGIFVALLVEHTSARRARPFLVAMVITGLASVAYWHWTDDLRLYVWVQLAPLLTVAAVILLFPPPYTHRRYLLAAGALYVVAKLVEHNDAALFHASGGLVSGHTLKHLLAAAGCYVLALMLRRRAPITVRGRAPAGGPLMARPGHDQDGDRAQRGSP
jgi:hypothetical protein